MNCAVCHTPLNAGARFCSNCGTALVSQAPRYMAGYAESRLVRPRQGRVVAGVCEGFALRYGWDPIVVRLVVVLAMLMGVGMPVLVYVVAWIIMPNAPYALPMRTGPTPS